MITVLGKDINYKDYTQATTIAHYMPWWKTPGHLAMKYTLPDGSSVPYDSADSRICDAQCQRLLKQGVDGINVDYYGPDHPTALAAIRMLDACERAGLLYSICIDQGALGSLTGAAATAEYIRIMKFVSETFLKSPSYLQDTGRYIFNFFGEALSVDWNAVQASQPKAALVFEGGSGFVHTASAGSFGWVNPVADPTSINAASVQSFIASATANPTKLAFYPIYPGFDDSMAAWGKKRMMSRRLGQTILDTLALIPVTAKYAIVDTFNDHEEGSGTEFSQG